MWWLGDGGRVPARDDHSLIMPDRMTFTYYRRRTLRTGKRIAILLKTQVCTIWIIQTGECDGLCLARQRRLVPLIFIVSSRFERGLDDREGLSTFSMDAAIEKSDRRQKRALDHLNFLNYTIDKQKCFLQDNGSSL